MMFEAKLTPALALVLVAMLASACATNGAKEAPTGLENDFAGAPSSDAEVPGFGDSGPIDDGDSWSSDATLTDAPLGPPQDVPSMSSETDDSINYQSSFDEASTAFAPDANSASEQNETSDLSSMASVDTLPATEAPTSSSSPTRVKQATKTSKSQMSQSSSRQVRYVKGLLLNVRSAPSHRAPIVRRFLGGARIQIEQTEGGFAKVKDGQWVSVSHLSAKPTRKVSRTEAARAWKRSKYKDTWRPASVPNS